MGQSAQGTSSRLMGRALLASLVVHGLTILLIPSIAWTPTSGRTIETISFTRVARIEIAPRPVVAPPPRAAAPHHSVAVTIVHVSRKELGHAVHRAASPPPAVAQRVASAPFVAPAPKAGVENGSGNAAPQVSASPTSRQVSSEVGHSTGGYMPFGAELPTPVLDPGVAKALAGLNVHVTLTVTVGDDGKTKDVHFDPPLDDRTRARIESLLADASWDPAVCGGGIACQAQATIRL